MARAIERTSSTSTAYTYRAERTADIRSAGPLAFSRVLAQLMDPAPGEHQPAVSAQGVLSGAYIRPVSVSELSGSVLYGWSYHDLTHETVSFKTTGDANEAQKAFMQEAAANFNQVEAQVVHEIFAGADMAPKSMSMTFTDNGILYLLAKPDGRMESKEFDYLLDKVNRIYDAKHRQLNEEWLKLVVG